MDWFSITSGYLRSLSYLLGIVGLSAYHIYTHKKDVCTIQAEAVVGREGLEGGVRAACASVFKLSSFRYNVDGEDVVVHGRSRNGKIRLEQGQSTHIYYNPENITEYYVPHVSLIPLTTVCFVAALFIFLTACVIVPAFSPNGFGIINDGQMYQEFSNTRHSIFNKILFPAFFASVIMTIGVATEHKFFPKEEREHVGTDCEIKIAGYMNLLINGLIKSAADIVFFAGLILSSVRLIICGIAAGFFLPLIAFLIISLFVSNQTIEEYGDMKTPPINSIIHYIGFLALVYSRIFM